MEIFALDNSTSCPPCFARAEPIRNPVQLFDLTAVATCDLGGVAGIKQALILVCVAPGGNTIRNITLSNI